MDEPNANIGAFSASQECLIYSVVINLVLSCRHPPKGDPVALYDQPKELIKL